MLCKKHKIGNVNYGGIMVKVISIKEVRIIKSDENDKKKRREKILEALLKSND